MSSIETQPSQAAPIVLPAVLDLTTADTLHTLLQTGLDQANALVIDGSCVDVISTACLQVLVAGALTARGRGGSVALLTPSPALLAAAGDLGLTAVLALGPA